jgi:uncharacterized protein YdaU (DUF1376 family)
VPTSSDIRPWYRWHWHKYRKSDRTLTLSLAGHGAYRNLLDAMWERGGQIPSDRNLLWRLALATDREEYDAVAEQVEAFFTLSEDGKHFTNETLAQEWQGSTEYLSDIREKRSAAGKKGNASRWGGSKQAHLSQTGRKGVANAIAPPSQADGKASHSSSSSSSTEDQNLGELLADSFNPSEASRKVQDELALSGQRMWILATECVEKLCKAESITPALAAEAIVARWKDYDRRTVSYKLGKQKWLETGGYITATHSPTQAETPSQYQARLEDDARAAIQREQTKAAQA